METYQIIERRTCRSSICYYLIGALGLDSRLEAIGALIPIGLMVVAEELQREVERLAGERYQRKKAMDGPRRYGSNPGTVTFLGQKVPIRVPRVRDATGELPLESYQHLHRGTPFDEGLLHRILYGLSCRDYSSAVEAIPEAIGVSKSTVSKRFVEASAHELKALM